MQGWFNWREIEKNNDWGVRDKSCETSELWGKAVDHWEETTAEKQEFTKLQVARLNLSKYDRVLDICCGTGPLTLEIAPFVKEVIAFDYSESMLERVRQKAKERGLDNVKTLQGDWYSAVPGRDIPVCDIAVTRHSPAQGNILKMSRTASKHCYSLWRCYSAEDTENISALSAISRAGNEKTTQALNRPNGRIFGFNAHFNLLYDYGANPTVNYAEQVIERFAKTKAELFQTAFPDNGVRSAEQHNQLFSMFEQDVNQTPDGQYRHYKKNALSILGWNPNEIHFPKDYEL